MDADYLVLDMETIFHKLIGASNFANIDLSDIYYQIELDDESEKYTQPTHLMDCSRCVAYFKYWKTLRQSSRIKSLQYSEESKLLWSLISRRVGLWNYKRAVRKGRLGSFKGRLGEKNLKINKKNSFFKSIRKKASFFKILYFNWGNSTRSCYNIKSSKTLPNNKQFESLVGL